SICDAVCIPVIGDGDTGYGNTANVKRTVHGYFQTGFAGIMIEDQRSPKRCGHTKGKEVVSREAALQRFRAAVEAREELRARGDDIILMARTDARATHGLGEALERAGLFAELGADILFVEAPESEDEMQAVCREVPGYHLANMLEHGKTPLLPPAQLQEIGYKIAAYPLTLISTAAHAMRRALQSLRNGKTVDTVLEFTDLQQIVGFPEYDATLERLEGKRNEKDKE
ncbi:MAG: isocitrate lyase/PEP mutase family protein, partial [Deltaproteobacteria bacterium]|nr:isocitrate lyase/PEP mutase family protein [Deltaproteobacteria bacterium]